MKILIIQPEERHHVVITEKHLSQIREGGFTREVMLVSDSKELEHHLAEVEVIVGLFRSLPSLRSARKLKWIHGLGAGADSLKPEVMNSSILVSNSSGVAATPIAEHVLGFLLIFTRKFFLAFRNQQEKRWEKQKDLVELRGKTILVIGLGHIGLEVARLCSCLGAFVIAIDQEGKEKPDFVAKLTTLNHIHEMLSQADFVVICLPYTKETHYLFSHEQFNQMKRTAVLINIGRGKIVNEKELIEALEKKVIGGAALDVQEVEPLPEDSPLWAMEHVILTPHHSAVSDAYTDRAIEQFCVNLRAYEKGKPLPNGIDKTRGY